MKTPFMKNIQAHPLVIFWIGLLAGALIVGLIFFFKAVEMREYESNVLRGFNSSSVKMMQKGSKTALPTPIGGKNALPTPIGGFIQ